jgi:hypothetical protein
MTFPAPKGEHFRKHSIMLRFDDALHPSNLISWGAFTFWKAVIGTVSVKGTAALIPSVARYFGQGSVMFVVPTEAWRLSL